jgi:hypothetical protein
MNFLKDYGNIYAKITDEVTGVEYSLMDTIVNLIKRIEVLEKESVETSNVIYELQNKIDLLQEQNTTMINTIILGTYSLMHLIVMCPQKKYTNKLKK